MLKFALIGETSLLIACAEHILKNHTQCEIIIICTKNPEVMRWSQSRNISIVNNFKALEENLSQQRPDYLFSIANLLHIPTSIIQSTKKLAINYHDSLLPLYAGVHATSWAIFNNEKNHGITWHVMTSEFDAGDILEQVPVSIDENETAFTLNTKCYEAALSGFKSLFLNLLKGNPTFLKQDLSSQAYYGYKNQLPRSGIINWSESATDITRTIRSCTFGGYANRFGLVICLIGTQIYYVDQAEELKDQNATPMPGRIIDLGAGELGVETTTTPIKFIRLLNETGEVFNFQELCEKYQYAIGDFLPILSKAQYLEYEKLASFIAPHESYWLNQFLETEPLQLPQNLIIPDSDKAQVNFSLSALNLKNIEELIALIFIYIYRVNNQEVSTCFMGINSQISIDNNIPSIIAPYLPLRLTLTGEERFAEVVSNISLVKENNMKQKGFMRSLFIRHPIFQDIEIKSRLFPPIILHQGQVEDVAWSETIQLAIVITPNQKDCVLIGKMPSSELQQMLMRLQKMASSLSNTENIAHLPLLSENEYQQVIFDWNKTTQPYPENKTIHELFEAQVAKTPNDIALIYKSKKLTYGELNAQANQLAHCLKNRYKVNSSSLVLLCLDRSEHMLIAILAVLKAGGAYVPMDPGYPDTRISYILKDTKAKVLLTNQVYAEQLRAIAPTQALSILALDSEKLIKNLSQQKQTNLKDLAKINNLAYVIYTSGTTGKPKGVMIEHKNIVPFITNFTDFPLNKTDRLNMLSTTNYVFDIFGLEYLLPLFNGYYIELKDLTNPSLKINLRKYDCIQITPSKLELLIEQINYDVSKPEKEHTLILLIGGELINQAILKRIYELEQHLSANNQHVHFKVINVYGPTETTIWSTATYLEHQSDHRTQLITIGKPLSNETAYILDRNQNPLPIGVIGELYIGGAGLARGYFHHAHLTAEKFVPNPFQTETEKIQNRNERIYKTGDVACWLSNGNLACFGRNDFQVKIRGHRIELGEIENVLAKYPSIKQAVVLAKDYRQSIGTKYLVAYYVSEHALDESLLQRHLTTHLPEYMVPNTFVHLHKLPLTINGKLDRKALPEPELNRGKHYTLPRNEQEKLICRAFAKILNLEQVSIYDDFFQIGGNSIKAISLTSALQANFNINVADIFNLRTPKQLAQNAHFGKDMLKRKLEQVKSFYQNKKISASPDNNEHLRNKLDRYLANVYSLQIDYHHKKPIKNILLTGSTGYLGCNLLHQLLELTDYKIFLLVRATSSEEAFDRINKKFQFYFNKTLDYIHNRRIFIFAADLEKSDLGLSNSDYQTLVKQIDSIIHPAALTKHYGEYDKFHSANVQATINLLEFCKLTPLKDFHYVSTISVLNEGYLPHCDHYLFTEDDMADNLEGRSNVYVKTKYEGEKTVFQYQEYGINTTIYRVGNLAFISTNGRAQENIEDNAFLTRLKCMLSLKVMAEEISLEEISLVDLTAQAIIKLFDKQELSNNIYHIFNPNMCNLSSIFKQENAYSVKVVSIRQFIDIILKHLDNPAHQKIIERFLLHQGWLNEWHTQSTKIQILQDRTQFILKELGFEWPIITKDIFRAHLETNLTDEEIKT